MSLCSGVAGMKSSSREKGVLGAGMTAESASVGADASANMNVADGRVAAMASDIAVEVDDPVPVRSSWLMPTPFLRLGFCVRCGFVITLRIA